MNMETFEKECDEFAKELTQFLNEAGYSKNVVMRIFGDYLKSLMEETEDPQFSKNWYIEHLNTITENLER